jgi:Skp family chaperone for outer membrane proteins
MTFTPESVVIIIGALSLGIVNIITALRAERKISAVDAKADVIVGHVNSKSEKAEAKIDALTARVESLTGLLADRKQDAALLAQAAAAKEPPL